MKTTTIHVKNVVITTLILLITISIYIPSSVNAQPIITGIFYDPSGVDTGFEWIELYNTANESVDLTNYQIAKGNGVTPNDWTTLSQLKGIIAPNSFFLLGEVNVSSADFVLKVALFNGPDSVALLSENETIDLVGYGALIIPEYYLESPAFDVASGNALVRKSTISKIEGADQYVFRNTLNNSFDFVSSLSLPRNSLHIYRAPIEDNASVSLIVPLLPLTITNASITDDVATVDRVQWSLVNKKNILIEISDDSGVVNDTIDVKYYLTKDSVSRMLDSSKVTVGRQDSLVKLNDAIVLPSDLLPGNYTFEVVIATSTQQSIVKSWEVDILPTLGFDLCESLVLEKTKDGSYKGNCECTNLGNVKTKASFDLKFVNDVKYTSFVEVGGEILQLNTSTIMFEPGQMKEITIVANISSWLRFGTYKGVLSALAQASNE